MALQGLLGFASRCDCPDAENVRLIDLPAPSCLMVKLTDPSLVLFAVLGARGRWRTLGMDGYRALA
jgi:hypothetical protein